MARRVRPVLRRPLVWARHREIQEGDAVLDEYPKSGGTWLTFMLAEAITGNPVDFLNHTHLSPAVGAKRRGQAILPNGKYLLRTHEPYRTEYRISRPIYLVRHVADVLVSYHQTLRWLTLDDVDPKLFIRLALAGHIDGYGSWPEHVRSWLEAPVDVCVIRYEDLRIDPIPTLRRAVEHMGLPLDDAVLERAVRSNQFDAMRTKEQQTLRRAYSKRDHSGHFVRSGRSGESREVFDDDDWKLIDRHAGSMLRLLGYTLKP